MAKSETTTPVSPRARLSRIAFCLAMVLGMVATTTAPANAQGTKTDDQTSLEAQEAALIDDVATAEQTIDELSIERSQVLVDIDAATAAIEGSADALEFLALARREPARVRVTMALERFVSGDPAQTAFARELQTLEQDASPMQNQEVFGSVVEAADAELSRIDGQITSLQADVPAMIEARQELANRLITIDAAVRGLQVGLDDSRAQLATVQQSLAWYRNAGSRSQLTGRPNAGTRSRAALVVKIDNVPRARPQAGINDADIVYVELVEGGQTRLAAVFHSENVGTVGPVRSMRTTDINLVRPLNRPLFANSGGNARTTAAINASPLVNIGHATRSGGAYYRNNSRPAPHNLFSSTAALRRAGGTAGGTPPTMFTIRRPGTPNPNKTSAANGVSVSYRNTNVSYTWNGSGWARSQDGRATVDTAGVRTAPETVIVQFTPYGVSPADRNSPEANVIGKGRAWIFTEGKLIRGSWRKPTADAVPLYFDSEGNPIQLLPGRVWVELPTPGNASLR